VPSLTARLDPLPSLRARWRDRTFEYLLVQSPLLAVLAHADDGALRASPHALAGRFEASRDQLAQLVRDCFGRRFRRRPDHWLFSGTAWLGKHTEIWLFLSRLLQRQPEQLGALFLGKESSGDARPVLRA